MTTCLLVRHGQSEANVGGTLAGHLDVPLTAAGTEQARQVAAVLKQVPLAHVVTSPLRRCRATAEEIVALQQNAGALTADDAFAEVRYGAWTGRHLKDLVTEELWRTIQTAPSQVTFPADPDGRHETEAMSEMAERAWAAWDTWERRIAKEHGDHATWVVVSHGDVIKALLARALGLELDGFQSIVVDPGSVSLVHRHEERTAVLGMNLRDDAYSRLASAASGAGHAAQPESVVGVVGGGNA